LAAGAEKFGKNNDHVRGKKTHTNYCNAYTARLADLQNIKKGYFWLRLKGAVYSNKG